MAIRFSIPFMWDWGPETPDVGTGRRDYFKEDSWLIDLKLIKKILHQYYIIEINKSEDH